MSLDLRGIKIFADGDVLNWYQDRRISGFTTNPTLIGMNYRYYEGSYESIAKEMLRFIGDRPISFEVTADDFIEIERQAKLIASWGKNVYVKVPTTLCDGTSTAALIRRLSSEGVKINVTGILLREQVMEAAQALTGGAPSCISVFAGRVSDTGTDPVPLMQWSAKVAHRAKSELIWASAREVRNVLQARSAGCDIITLTPVLIAKLPLLGKSHREFSLETVRQFHKDGQELQL